LTNSDLIHAQKIWFGLPGEQSLTLTDDAKEVLTDKLINYDCIPVFVDQEQFNGHYNQVCKQVIILLLLLLLFLLFVWNGILFIYFFIYLLILIKIIIIKLLFNTYIKK